MVLNYTITPLKNGPDANWIVGGQQEYVRRLQVVVTDNNSVPVEVPGDCGPNRLLTDIGNPALGGDASLVRGQAYQQQIGSLLDQDANSTLRSIVPLRDPSRRDRWVVTATYNTLSETDNTYDDSGNQDVGSWLTERPMIEWQQINYTEAAKYGWLYSKGPPDGSAGSKRAKCPPDFTPSSAFQFLRFGGITNSAGGFLGDPPPEKDVERQGIVVERNLNDIDFDQIGLLTNSVNQLAFAFTWRSKTHTIKPYWGKLKAIVPREHFRGGTWCWRVRYEFDIWDRTWVEDFLDMGWEAVEFTNLGNPAFDQSQGRGIKSLDDVLTRQQTLLKNDGKTNNLPLDGPSGEESMAIENVCYRSYLLYDPLDWNQQPDFWMLNNFPNNYNNP